MFSPLFYLTKPTGGSPQRPVSVVVLKSIDISAREPGILYRVNTILPAQLMISATLLFFRFFVFSIGLLPRFFGLTSAYYEGVTAAPVSEPLPREIPTERLEQQGQGLSAATMCANLHQKVCAYTGSARGFVAGPNTVFFTLIL